MKKIDVKNYVEINFCSLEIAKKLDLLGIPSDRFDLARTDDGSLSDGAWIDATGAGTKHYTAPDTMQAFLLLESLPISKLDVFEDEKANLFIAQCVIGEATKAMVSAERTLVDALCSLYVKIYKDLPTAEATAVRS